MIIETQIWRIIRIISRFCCLYKKRYIPELGAGLFNKFLELSIWSSGWLLRTVLTLRAIFESSKVTLIFVSGDEESCFLSSREKMALFLVESWTWWLTGEKNAFTTLPLHRYRIQKENPQHPQKDITSRLSIFRYLI